MIERLASALQGYRKVLVVIATLFISALALASSRLTGDQFVNITQFVVGTFLAANVGAKIASKERPNAKD